MKNKKVRNDNIKDIINRKLLADGTSDTYPIDYM